MNAESVLFLVAPLIGAMLSCGCQPRGTTAVLDQPTAVESEGLSGPAGEVKNMQAKSSFENGAKIDKKHTGEGQDLSPPLSWSGVPEGTKSFALICDDPDAPSPKRPNPTPWVHWVIYNIPGSATQLPGAIPRVAVPSEVVGAKQGKNSFGSDNTGYRGPMPPPGSGAHRYFFKLYALDTELNLDPNKATKDSLLAAMKGHVLAEGQLMGKYER